VAFTSKGPTVRPTSTEAFRARSERSPSGGSRRESPAASISSTKGVGAKNPPPTDARKVQGPGR
jgi:hypothetical protein